MPRKHRKVAADPKKKAAKDSQRKADEDSLNLAHFVCGDLRFDL